MEILSRPEKLLYDPMPGETYQDPYLRSRFNLVNPLPAVYKIRSGKWPVNYEDPEDGIGSVSSYVGFAQFNLTGTYQTYKVGDWVRVTGDYEGVFQILFVQAPTQIVLNVAFNATATGTLQHYYNNYRIEVKLWAGLPPDHPLNSEDVVREITTTPVVPDANNVATVDIAPLIRQNLSTDNDLSQTMPDLNIWTSFFIQYQETYDESDGVALIKFESGYQDDVLEGCSPGTTLENESFDGTLDPWYNEDYLGTGSSPWTHTAGAARYSSSAGFVTTQMLLQNYNLQAGVTREITVTCDLAIFNLAWGLRIVTIDPSGVIQNFVVINQIGDPWTSKSVVITPPVDCSRVGFFLQIWGVPPTDFDITSFQITSLNVVNYPCRAYCYGINGTRQMQDIYGGNLGNRIGAASTSFPIAKWMNLLFMKFSGYRFELSTWIGKEALGDLRLLILRDSGFELVSITQTGEGVYRIQPPEGEECGAAVTYQLLRLPENGFVDANGGGFEDKGLLGSEQLQTFEGHEGHTIDVVAPFDPYEGTYCGRIGTDGVASDLVDPVIARTGLVDGEPYYQLTQGRLYYMKAAVQYLNPDGYFLSDDYKFIITPDGLEPDHSIGYNHNQDGLQWKVVKTLITAPSTQKVRIGFQIQGSLSTSDVVVQAWFVDAIEFYEVVEVTESVPVTTYCECLYPTHLTWLNKWGAWENFVFSAKKDHVLDVEETTEGRRNIFTDFDTNFIGSEQQDFYRKIMSRDGLVIRSQYVSKDQLQALQTVLDSIRVQIVADDGSKKDVLVEPTSYKIFTDGDSQYSLEFSIRMTNYNLIQYA